MEQSLIHFIEKKCQELLLFTMLLIWQVTKLRIYGIMGYVLIEI